MREGGNTKGGGRRRGGDAFGCLGNAAERKKNDGCKMSIGGTGRRGRSRRRSGVFEDEEQREDREEGPRRPSSTRSPSLWPSANPATVPGLLVGDLLDSCRGLLGSLRAASWRWF